MTSLSQLWTGLALQETDVDSTFAGFGAFFARLYTGYKEIFNRFRSSFVLNGGIIIKKKYIHIILVVGLTLLD